jgi:hypothetical protein
VRVRRRAAVVAFVALVLLGVPTGMLGIAWPSMRASLEAPFAGLGALLAAMTVAQFAASAASGLLRERLGTIAVLLAAVGAAAGGLASSPSRATGGQRSSRRPCLARASGFWTPR